MHCPSSVSLVLNHCRHIPPSHYSETVHLDLFFPSEADLFEKLADVLSLVSLQLDDLSVLWVLYHRTVTRKLLLGVLDNFLEVKLGGDSLDGGESLAAVTLLNTDVYVAILSRDTLYRTLLLRKRISLLKILNNLIRHEKAFRSAIVHYPTNVTDAIFEHKFLFYFCEKVKLFLTQ